MPAGSVYQRSDGLWCASIQVNGTRKYLYAKTQQQVKKKLAELQKQLGVTNNLPKPGRKTVNDLLDLWLETAELRPITVVGYQRTLDNHVRPAIGHIRLSRLRPETIQKLYNHLKAKDLKRTPRLVHSLLHRAFKMAVYWGWLADNPADRVMPPSQDAKRKDIWSQDELQTFLTGTADHWLQPLWVLALSTGMRLAELSGLQWSDVDLLRGTVTVRRALHNVKGEWIEGKPKTKAGERIITLPADGIAALKKQKIQQAEWRLKAGQDWQNQGLVFTNETGMPLSRSTIQHAINAVCRRLQIPDVSIHGLRHLHASLLLAGGLPVPAVSARLGHANPNITMAVYAHALSEQDQEAARLLDKVLTA